MERKIGEEFGFEGKRLKVVEVDEHDCRGCFFIGKCTALKVLPTAGHCVCRNDNRFVIFEEVAKKTDDDAPEVTETSEENDGGENRLDLRVILRNCPEGEMFWSPMLDAVRFLACGENYIDVMTKGGETWNINPDGTITIGNVTSPECMLFPDKEQRDWGKVHYDMPIDKLPKSWKEFCETHGVKKGEAYFNTVCDISVQDDNLDTRDVNNDRNVLPSEEAARQHLSLMQLHQLRDCYRDGWKPEPNNERWGVTKDMRGTIELDAYTGSVFLSFQDKLRAELFVQHFRNLIEEAGDLI